MTEQELLKKLKESADSVEIPESLQPKQIENMLNKKIKNGKMTKKGSWQWQAKHLIAAAILLVFALAAVPIGLNVGEDGSSTNAGKAESAAIEKNITEEKADSVKKQDAGEMYVVAKNYEEVYEFLQEYENLRYEYSVENGVVFESAQIEKEESAAGGEAPAMDDANAVQDLYSGSVMENKNEYSTTNLQMAGVDESDIVKTNGTHLFLVSEETVKIIEVNNGAMKQVGTIKPELSSFSDTVLEMYVDDNKLMLLVQQCEEQLKESSYIQKNSGEKPSLGDMIVEKCGTEEDVYEFDNSYCTVLYTYDISNPKQPDCIGEVTVDGAYKTSRKIEDVIYLFTQETVWADTEDFLPCVNDEVISYDCIYLPERGNQGLVAVSVDLDNPNDVVDKTLIFNNFVEIYVSKNAMYLYNYGYESNREVTEIAKFSLKDGVISATAAATVPGMVRDTFAINEYQQNLRVLTTEWDSTDSQYSNQLFILDENLKRKGSIEDVAEGEQIYAARYFGNLAYFITYRNIDPLFAADLSDVNNPKIVGELEITGYSEYLHMWGEDKLLGIGYETDPDDGSREGIKLVMFDISNPAELSIIDTVVLKDADYSAALYNYKCVVAEEGENLIGFTTAKYNGRKEDQKDYLVYSFADGRFKEELSAELGSDVSEESCRGLYIGDYFYIVNEDGAESFDRMNGYEKESEMKFYIDGN